MIRVGILMFQNMRYAPFLKMYENIIKEIPDASYDVIYYNRDKSLNEINEEHYIPIAWYGKGTVAAPKYEKIANFFIYRHEAKKKIINGKYDFLIVLTTFPAVLLSDFLVQQYRGRYIVDIRDYTQEQFGPYFFLEKIAFANSAMRVISSPGFVNFLPADHYIVCHNIDDEFKNEGSGGIVKASNGKIIISYIGSISYEKQCRQLIDLVSKDERFEFRLFGNEANGNVVSQYVERLNNPRIKMMGAFQPSEKEQIYNQSDLIFNCYGNDSPLVKYAISNKYYDGALYRKPLLVSPNTAMADMSGGFAYRLDLDSVNDLNGLIDWYAALNPLEYNAFACNVIKTSFAENNDLKRMIKKKIQEL